MRVMLADDQAEVRSALRLLIEEKSQDDVVGEVAEAAGLLIQIQQIAPDLLLLDWELPGLRADDMLPALRSYYPGLLVIALSGRPEARKAASAAGIDAFISKGSPPEQILGVLDRIRNNRANQRPANGSRKTGSNDRSEDDGTT
jgi:DNA-binding NarL/FixJ family response regulator